MAATGAGNNGFDEHGGRVTRQIWKWTVLAGMASYIDAGSLVALGVRLALWEGGPRLWPTPPGGPRGLRPGRFGGGVRCLVGGGPRGRGRPQESFHLGLPRLPP